MGSYFTTKNIENLKTRGIFFETNILIYLFWASSNQEERKHQDRYATIFNKLKSQNNKLYIDIFVISEIINTVLRIEFKKHKSEYVNFKKFKQSEIGRKTQEDIHSVIHNKIFKSFEFINQAFNENLLKKFLVVDDLDFNDKVISSICKEKNLVLLTHDIDYKGTDIHILTGNNKYFK